MQIINETEKFGFSNWNYLSIFQTCMIRYYYYYQDLLSVIILAAMPLPSWSQLGTPSNNEPTMVAESTNLAIEKYAGGMEFPSSMAFLGPDDILVLEKNTGQVKRIVNKTILEEPVLDVPVAVKDERGLLGIAITKDNQTDATFVFLYDTEIRLETETTLREKIRLETAFIDMSLLRRQTG